LTRFAAILVLALVAMGTGLLLLAASGAPVVLLVGVGLLAASFNVAMPTAMGFASRLSSEGQQGSVMGTMSSAVSLASVVGPIVAGGLFSISPRGSYAAAGAVAFAAAALSLRGIKVGRPEGSEPRRRAAGRGGDADPGGRGGRP